jgi:hypothetical protein
LSLEEADAERQAATAEKCLGRICFDRDELEAFDPVRWRSFDYASVNAKAVDIAESELIAEIFAAFDGDGIFLLSAPCLRREDALTDKLARLALYPGRAIA